MTRLQRICAPLWAFLLTLGVLLGVGCAARVEYVTHRTLHGHTAVTDVAAWDETVLRFADTAERYLPPRCRAVTVLLRTAERLITRPATTGTKTEKRPCFV